MDLKTIIAITPLLRRLYRKLPRPLRLFGLVIGIVVAARRLFRRRNEEDEVGSAGGGAGVEERSAPEA